MTLAEIMAGLGASQAIGQASTGALLTRTAEGERRDILDAQRELEEQQRARQRKAKTREKRRGIGRLIGSAAGALLALPTGGLSLAAGAALGSALGQAGAAATEKGGYKLGDVRSGLGEGMFFKGGRADISSAEADINRYLDDANTGDLQNIGVSAVTDYLTASSLGKLEGFGKYADIAAGEGGRGAALSEMFKDTIFKKAPVAPSTVGSSTALGQGTLGDVTDRVLERFQFDKGFYGDMTRGYDARVAGRLGGTNFMRGSLYNPLLQSIGG